jgi:hypothetical protein
MMPAFFASDPISVVLRSRENPLPWPITTGIRILALPELRRSKGSSRSNRSSRSNSFSDDSRKGAKSAKKLDDILRESKIED